MSSQFPDSGTSFTSDYLLVMEKESASDHNQWLIADFSIDDGLTNLIL